MKRSLLVLLALLVLAGASGALYAWLNPRAAEAMVLAARVGQGMGPATPLIQGRSTFSWEEAGWSYLADVYRPDGPHKADLLLLPGADPSGKNHPRLVAFARVLASAGFRVMVPDLPSYRGLELSEENTREVIRALAALSRLRGESGTDPARPVGLFAISFAVGPSVLAALQRPDLAPDFLVALGGYHSVDAVLTYVLTGYYRRPGEEAWRHRPPNAYGKWVFLEANMTALEAPLDRELLGAIAERRRTHPDLPIADLTLFLSDQGRAALALIEAETPEEVAERKAALPPALLARFAALDLAARDLSPLTTQLVLIHGSDDPIIPSSESRALADALPQGAGDLYLVDSLSHVEVTFTGLWDAFQLWRAVLRVLELRDGVA